MNDLFTAAVLMLNSKGALWVHGAVIGLAEAYQDLDTEVSTLQAMLDKARSSVRD